MATRLPTRPSSTSSAPSSTTRTSRTADAVFRGPTVFVTPPPSYTPGSAPGSQSVAQASALPTSGILSALPTGVPLPPDLQPTPDVQAAPVAPLIPPSTPGPTQATQTAQTAQAAFDSSAFASSPDSGGDYAPNGSDQDGPAPDEGDTFANASAALEEDVAAQETEQMDTDESSGFDSLGAYVGDTGFSIPELWKLLNSMRPMTKAMADAVLSRAVDVTDWAANGLSGSDATKARSHVEALKNTRESIANASDDPLSDPDASGVRTMVAQGFTYANTLANTNAMNAEHLSMLWSDLKENATSLPSKIYMAVMTPIKAVGTGIKWIAIGGGIVVAIIGGAYIYRKVRT